MSRSVASHHSTPSAGLLALLSLTALTACEGSKFLYAGQPIPAYFPLDGQRTWVYQQCPPDDAACVVDDPRQLVISKVGSRQAGDTQVVSLTYAYRELVPEDTGTETGTTDGGDSGTAEEEPSTDEVFATVEWSSDSTDGVQIWSWTDAEGVETPYATPLRFADPEMSKGDAVYSENLTSTYVEQTYCQTRWVADTEWECALMRVEGGAGTEPFLGDWWLASSYGVAHFVPAGGSVPWVLAGATFSE